MYTIYVKTFSDEYKQFHYINADYAFEVFHRLTAAQDAKAIVMIDGLTGEWYASYEKIGGAWEFTWSDKYTEEWI